MKRITPYFETKLGKLYYGDCLEIMPLLDISVNMVLADPPYGMTGCKWDSVIPLEPMWNQLKRIIKMNSTIVITSSQPFTSLLVVSNIKIFKYCWVWNKKVASNSQLAKFQPLKIHEDICVFGNKVRYYPQGLIDCNIERSNKNREKGVGHIASWKKRDKFVQVKKGYPKSIQNFKPHNINKIHPTQKPVALFEYLIKTYTNENDLVLDFCIGSGTTAAACEELNRRWIGIEIEEKYCKIVVNRIEKLKNKIQKYLF